MAISFVRPSGLGILSWCGDPRCTTEAPTYACRFFGTVVRMSGACGKRRMLGPAGLAFAAGLVLVGAARSAYGCFIMSHHWRIVLGETDSGVVVLGTTTECVGLEAPLGDVDGVASR